MLNNCISLIISAPSGAGKTTLIRKFISNEKKCEFVISCTTRLPRKKEVNGRDYYFINKDDFEIRIKNNEFLEWSSVHNNYYGIEKKEFDRIISLEKIPLFDVDVQGARKLKEKIDNTVLIFIAPPTIEGLKKRLYNRGTDSRETIELRLKNAINELKEIKFYDYLVINDKVKESILDLKSILRAEFCRKQTQSQFLEFCGEAN